MTNECTHHRNRASFPDGELIYVSKEGMASTCLHRAQPWSKASLRGEAQIRQSMSANSRQRVAYQARGRLGLGVGVAIAKSDALWLECGCPARQAVIDVARPLCSIQDQPADTPRPERVVA